MRVNKTAVLIGFYDDYARFYIELDKELNKKDINVKHLYINLSGYLYSKLRGVDSEWISFLNVSGKNEIVFGEDAFLYHSRINNKYFGINRLRFIAKAKKYYRSLFKYFSETLPDVVLLPGEYRLAEFVAKLVCQKLGIKIMYFEQGPYGTTLIDCEGVNANASIRFKYDQLNDHSIIRRQKEKYKRNPAYRVADMLLSSIFSTNGFFIDLFENKSMLKSILSFRKLQGQSISIVYDKYVLLALQVPNDANFTHHSPLYKSFYEMVRDVRESLPSHIHLIVREHPLFYGLYESRLYKYISNCSGVSLENNKKLNDQILGAEFVVVNNSTTGMDALALGSKVLVLGDSYYDNLSTVYKLKVKSQLKCIISEILIDNVDPAYIKSTISSFVENNFISGHYRDCDLSFVNIVADRLDAR